MAIEMVGAKLLEAATKFWVASVYMEFHLSTNILSTVKVVKYESVVSNKISVTKHSPNQILSALTML
jgi:hypothetical protein